MIVATGGVEDVSTYLDTLALDFSSNLGASSIFACVSADTASAACPAQSGSLAITSITSAAVICEADDPCSVNTAYAPESSFLQCHLGARLDSSFCIVGALVLTLRS